MPPSLRITIPEPCHEDWNAMTPAQQGRHCASCNKVVMDFTNMSDAQIIVYFQSAKGNTCGRFYNNQLNREFYLYTTTTAGKRTRIRYIAVSMLVAQLFACRSYAADMLDTSKIRIDSCGVVSIDTATSMAQDTLAPEVKDSLELKWDNDTTQSVILGDTYNVTCTETYGYTTISGMIGPEYVDTFHEVGPWHKYVGKGYLWLQQTRLANFLFPQNEQHLARINRKLNIVETPDAPLAAKAPKPSKPKQVLNWLATLPRRVKIKMGNR